MKEKKDLLKEKEGIGVVEGVEMKIEMLWGLEKIVKSDKEMKKDERRMKDEEIKMIKKEDVEGDRV